MSTAIEAVVLAVSENKVINTFGAYQTQAFETASYPDLGKNMVYPALGLAGEAGETADKVKKFWRNDNITSGKELNEEQLQSVVKEIGDVLWYCAALCNELGTTLEYVAYENIKKLHDRRNRGVIKSEGDNR